MSATQRIQSINDITNIVYINLDTRTDRKMHIEKQLTDLGFPSFQRFNAIKNYYGAIGCTLSHLKCLEDAYNKDLNHVLICEDDTTFLNGPLLKKQLNDFLQKSHSWDVVLLAGNNVVPYNIIDNTCIKVTHCQTTTCYLVNGPYLKTLINNIKNGLRLLDKNPNDRFNFAIDKFWIQLQKIHNWYLITPPTVIQLEGYSDIEKCRVSYASIMLNIHKSIKLN